MPMAPPVEIERYPPLNEAGISDYSAIPPAQLLVPWTLPDADVNRTVEYATECSVIIKGIPAMTGPHEILPLIMTMDGDLPWGNHEVIGANMRPGRNPGERNQGVAFIRWSSPQWAMACVRRFDRLVFNEERYLKVQISNWPVKINCSRGGRPPLREGIFAFEWAWQLAEM